MKPHPRIRKTIKWTGAAVTLLLVVLWVGSRWWGIQWQGEDGMNVGISTGLAFFVKWDLPMYAPLGFNVGAVMPEPEMNWWFWIEWGVNDPHVGVPVWMIALLSALPTIAAWRLDTLARRRARLNLCPKCNYDRAGLPGGKGAVCPECGAASASS